MSARYMLWRDDAAKLKAMVNDREYGEAMSRLKQVDVLYIDDFLKTPPGTSPTAGDINLAFELLNHRYNSGRLTVISSEKTIDDIIRVDPALGSRIFEASRGHGVIIGEHPGRNYRLKGAKGV